MAPPRSGRGALVVRCMPGTIGACSFTTKNADPTVILCIQSLNTTIARRPWPPRYAKRKHSRPNERQGFPPQPACFCGAGSQVVKLVLWGRVYPGRRGWDHHRCPGATPLAGVKPAPQERGTAARRPGRAEVSSFLLCEAGLIPRDGGWDHRRCPDATPLAGVKPAPQERGTAARRPGGAEVFSFLWGRVYPGRRGWDDQTVPGRDAAGRRKAGPTGAGNRDAAPRERGG